MDVDGGRIALTIDLRDEAPDEVSVTVYRDGEALVRDRPGGAGRVVVDEQADPAGPTRCYSVETTYLGSGNHSQHSPPACGWGPGSSRVDLVLAPAMQHVGGELSESHGRPHYDNWGDLGHTLTVPAYVARFSGRHLLQVDAGNGAGSVNTGVTCAVKRLDVTDLADGARIGDGYLVMPHLGDWDRWAGSSFVPVTLEAGHTYRVEIGGDERAVNMSAFEHFARYTGGTGGRAGAFDRVNISALRILAQDAL